MINGKPETIQEAVKQLRDETGLTWAQMGVRAGLDGSTIWKIADTGRGSMDTVARLARKFGRDVNEWLELAGYDPVEPSPDDAAEALLEAADRGELDDLDTEGIDVDVAGFAGPGSMTENDRRRINAVLAKLIAADRKRKGLD